MKTLKNKKGNKIVRVPDKKPNEIEGILDLLEKGWKYCPKSEWNPLERRAQSYKKRGLEKQAKKIRAFKKEVRKLVGSL